MSTVDIVAPSQVPESRRAATLPLVGLAVVLVLAWVTHYLNEHVPEWADGTGFEKVAKTIEFPVYAIAIGLIANLVLTLAGVRDRIAGGFRTEFLIKTGVVLLGASINLKLIVDAAAPAILQAVLLITSVFLIAWWLGGLFGLDHRLRALLASAVSICGVSAAIAAAGSVQAKKEQLAYAASLVIVFAIPSIFILPWAAESLGLEPAVAGAWIGGNIDTTAAVTAAGAIAGDDVLQIATIVKITQNALIGVVAIALAAWFAYRVDRTPGSARPRWAELWTRFPKFVLGFLAASVIATVYLNTVSDAAAGKETIAAVTELRTWFLIAAFVSIGLEFKVTSLREAGWRPVAVFAGATVANLAIALALASILFRDFTISA